MAGAALCEPPRAEIVAGAALCEPPCSVRGCGCCVVCGCRRLSAVVCGCRRWSPVRSSIVQNSWQAQHFVNLHAQSSWQAQHFVTAHTETSPEFVAGAALCEPPCSVRGCGRCVVCGCLQLSAVVGGGRRSVPPLRLEYSLVC